MQAFHEFPRRLRDVREEVARHAGATLAVMAIWALAGCDPDPAGVDDGLTGTDGSGSLGSTDTHGAVSTGDSTASATEGESIGSSDSSGTGDPGVECSIAGVPACAGGRLDCDAEAHVPCGDLEAAYDRFGCRRLDCTTHADCPSGAYCMTAGWTFPYDCQPGSTPGQCECEPPAQGGTTDHCVDLVEWPDAPLHAVLDDMRSCPMSSRCEVVTLDEGAEVLSEFTGYEDGHRCVLTALRDRMGGRLSLRSEHDPDEWANAYRLRELFVGQGGDQTVAAEMRWVHGPALPSLEWVETVELKPREYFEACLLATELEAQRECLNPDSWWTRNPDVPPVCPGSAGSSVDPDPIAR